MVEKIKALIQELDWMKEELNDFLERFEEAIERQRNKLFDLCREE